MGAATHSARASAPVEDAPTAGLVDGPVDVVGEQPAARAATEPEGTEPEANGLELGEAGAPTVAPESQPPLGKYDAPEVATIPPDDESRSWSVPPSPHRFTPAEPTARQQRAPVVLERGHVDLIEVTVNGGRLVVSVKDHTTPGGPTFRSPAEVQLRVPRRAQTTVPDSAAYRFLGPAGSTVFLLPQTEDPALVWPGWSTERLRPGQVAGDTVTFRLAKVDGPAPVTLFTVDQFGAPKVLLQSGTQAELPVRINTHAHANWAFGSAGVYRLTFEVRAGLPGAGESSTAATYDVVVGDRKSVV